jgi:DinB family protein
MNNTTDKKMKNTLQIEWELTSNDLLQGLASIKTEDFNRIPFKGSWTAGQLAEHMEKAIGPEVLFGRVHPTERRPDEKVEAIQAVFLNFDIKMRSPDFIQPTGTVHQQDQLIASLEKKVSLVKEAISTLDLSETCDDFNIPVFGEFTRLEWISLFISHTQRHIRQLKNIAEKLKNHPASTNA